MGKKIAKRGRGRPKLANPLTGVVRVRVLPEMMKALDAYQRKHHLLDRSEAARQAMAGTLKSEGLL